MTKDRQEVAAVLAARCRDNDDPTIATLAMFLTEALQEIASMRADREATPPGVGASA